jgi:hypothetical protein
MRACTTLVAIALAQIVSVGCDRWDVIPPSELWRLDGMHDGSPRFIRGDNQKPIKITTHTRFAVVTRGLAQLPAYFEWIEVSNGRFTAMGRNNAIELDIAQIDRIEVETHDAAASNSVIGTIYGLLLVLALAADVVLIALAAGAGY